VESAKLKPKRRRVLASTLMAMVLVTLSLVPAQPAYAAEFTPPITCDAAHLGSLWYDDAGILWECEYTIVNGRILYIWVPIYVTISDSRLFYYSSTYGHTWVSTAFDSNPDYAAAMTHSRNPNGSTRIQGSGEIRSRVVFQKWNGSSWVTCKDSGYGYSNGAVSEWAQSYNMYTAADCGAGTYRVISYGYMYDGGAWRGSHITTPTCYRD
jgi:hypothetical protein